MTSKPAKCRLCGYCVPLTHRVDGEGFSVTQGWEALRDHWELMHAQEMEALQTDLDAFYGQD